MVVLWGSLYNRGKFRNEAEYKLKRITGGTIGQSNTMYPLSYYNAS